MLALLLALSASPPAPPPGPVEVARAVVQQATTAVEQGRGETLAQAWRAVRAVRPEDRPATLGLITLARLTNRPATIDSLLGVLAPRPDRPADPFTVFARLQRAESAAIARTLREAQLELIRARDEARAIGSPALEALALVALAPVQARLSGTGGALPLLATADSLATAATPAEAAQRRCLRGSLEAIASMPGGEARLRDGLRRARLSGARRVHADCSVRLASRLESIGRFTEAAAWLDTAAITMRHLSMTAPLAAVLQRRAFVDVQTGELARARGRYQAAITAAQQSGNRSVEGWALAGLAQIALSLQDLGEARALAIRARQRFDAQGDSWGRITVRALEGELLEALGEPDAARTALREAIALDTASGQTARATWALRTLIRLELAADRIDAAQAALTLATRAAHADGDAGWLNEVPYHAAGIALARGRPDVAARELSALAPLMRGTTEPPDQRYLYWTRVAVVAARRGRLADAEDALARALDGLQHWRTATGDRTIRLQLPQARRIWGEVGAEHGLLIDALARGGRVASAFRLAEAMRARELVVALQQRAARDTSAATPAPGRLPVAPLPSVTALQRSLDARTALVAWATGPRTTPTTLFVVTRDTLSAFRVPPIDSLTPTIDRARRLLEAGREVPTVAAELGRLLLPPPGALPAGIDRLVLIPERALYRLPFDALRLPDGRRLIERAELVIAPSATTHLLASTRQQPAGGGLFAFGDAVYTRPGARQPSLPALPASGAEVTRVARYARRADVRRGAAASEGALRDADLRGVSILHLATHALVDDRDLQRNIIALSADARHDGLVGAEELGRLTLRNALVVLSGCRTAGGVVLGGEGLRGLSIALLEAGARTVLATQWPIGDAGVVPMVDRIYDALARGRPVAAALREAKLDALRHAVSPAIWAAFTVIGDARLAVRLTPIAAPLLPWGAATTRAPGRDAAQRTTRSVAVTADRVVPSASDASTHHR
jgi:CHAT domain-containing protein/tetratricopeptide (TPR) repeat protein